MKIDQCNTPHQQKEEKTQMIILIDTGNAFAKTQQPFIIFF